MRVGKMIRSGLTIVVSLAVLGALLAWMSGAFHEKIEPHQLEAKARQLPPGAIIDEVHAIVETETTEAVGTLQAERRTVVSPKIMATIAAITVSAGDKVQKGQVLVRLDDRDMKAKMAQAQKAIEGAQAAAQQADVDLKRTRSLFESKVVSKAQLDQVESQYKIARAELSRAQEAANEANVGGSYTTIEAPADGVVVDKQADVGDTAGPGQPILSIYDPTALRLEAPVRETLASQIKVGDRLLVKIDALGLDLEGRVDEIVPQAAEASRSMLVKVAVPKQDKMVTGMSGRLILPTRERKRYCVPKSAVVTVGQLRFVDVVTTDGVERRAVKLGEHSEFGRVEAISGVEPGERVVLYGPKPDPLPAGFQPGGKQQ